MNLVVQLSMDMKLGINKSDLSKASITLDRRIFAVTKDEAKIQNF